MRFEAISGLCNQLEEVQLNCKTYDLRPYTSDMLKQMSEVQWFKQQFSVFGKIYQPIFVEVMTQRGMGFSFNLDDANELLDFKR